jgi:hypothetical protein
MTDLRELLLGQKEITIASSRSVNDCLHSIEILHRPGHAYQRGDTIVSLRQHGSNQYTIEISKRLRFFVIGSIVAAFGSMTSVSFTGTLEADAKGTPVLRGKVEFREWYYIGIALALLAIFISTLANPAYLLLSVIFLIFILILANWFARSDKDILLREVEYALS